jgi:hypothetical protein
MPNKASPTLQQINKREAIYAGHRGLVVIQTQLALGWRG